MSSITVIHTADWHLGVRLRDLDRAAEHAAFLTWLTETVERERASVLVVAGDVFDSASPPQSALKMWYDFLAELRARCPFCRVVAVAGNHDSPHVLEAAGAPLAGLGVVVAGEMPAEAADCLHRCPDAFGNPGVAVAAVPFLRDRDLRRGGEGSTAQDILEQLCSGIRDRYAAVAAAAAPLKSQGWALLATGHLTVAGGSTSDSERDIHVGNLGAVDASIFSGSFDYVALGHLHRPQAAGAGQIRYSGSPLPLSFSEWRDHKEVRVLTFENGTLTGSRGLPVPCSRPLVRVSTAADTLESSLAALGLPASPLPAWLEVCISVTSEPAAELAARVHAALAGRPAEAIAIRRMTAANPVGTLSTASIHELQPAEVFDAVLAAEGIPEAEREPLRLTFRLLLDRHHESTAAAP